MKQMNEMILDLQCWNALKISTETVSGHAWNSLYTHHEKDDQDKKRTRRDVHDSRSGVCRVVQRSYVPAVDPTNSYATDTDTVFTPSLP